MKSMRLLRLVPAALLLLALAGCQPLPGPLEFGGDSASGVCIDRPAGAQVLFGDFFTVPASSAQATITGVRLADAQGVTLTRSWLLPTVDGVIGVADYPPASSPAWEQREDAVDAVVAPGTQRNLVLLITRDGDRTASASAIVIDYAIGKLAFSKTGTVSIEVADSCADG